MALFFRIPGSRSLKISITALSVSKIFSGKYFKTFNLLNFKISGEPEVKCGAEVVDLQFRTIKPFKGKVFVKGHYADADCKVDYSDAGGTDKPNGGIIIHHGACDMQRQRMVSQF